MRRYALKMVKLFAWKLFARVAERRGSLGGGPDYVVCVPHSQQHKPRLRAAQFAVLGLLIAFILSPEAFAATFMVTSQNDAGPNTLRQAILDASLNTEADLIEFDSSLAGATIILTQSLDVNDDDVTVDGSTAPGITISGGGVGRVFLVDATSTLELVELTIADGDATVDIPNKGGGIYNKGTLFVTTCNIINNTANIGGGIANDDGTVTITHTTIANNIAATEPASFGVRGGGAVANDSGEVIIESSSLHNNMAGPSSSFSGDAFGGGLINISTFGPAGTVKMFNTTVSGNEASDDAGAIYNQPGDKITVISSTITGNLAASAGGGIENFSSIAIQNTILAGNTAGVVTSETSHDCRSLAGIITSHGHNLVGPTTCTFSNPTDLILGQAPLAGLTINDVIDTTLDANGGPTLTHALLGTSSAIDAGSCDGIAGDNIETDQRSLDRPFDDTAIPDLPGGDTCDIGAFERDFVSCVSKKGGEWKDSTTWSCGSKPTNSEDAVIAPGHEVTTVDDQAAKKLKVAGGKGRGLSGGGKLKTGQKFIDVHADLIIDGKLDPGTGKFDMKGTGKQKIRGKGNKKFHKLHISNEAPSPGDSADVETEGPIEVIDEMSVKKGQFRPDDQSSFKNLVVDSPGKLKPKLEAKIEVKGDMTKLGAGVFEHNQSTMQFTGTEKQKISGAFKFKHMDVDKTTTDDNLKDLELDTGTEVEGETKVKKGKLAPDTLTKFQKVTIETLGKLKPKPSAKVEVKGDMTKLGGGSFTHNESTMQFTGTEKQKISGAFKFKHVDVDKTTTDDEAKDLELGTGTEVEGETKVKKGKLAPDNLTKFQKLTIEGLGKLKPKPSAKVELKGDMTKLGGGVFEHNESTMQFTGTEKQKISGAFKFKHVDVDKTTTDDNLKDLELDTGTEVEGEAKVKKGKLTPDTLTKFQKVTIETLGKLKPKLSAKVEVKGDMTKLGGGVFEHNESTMQFTGTEKQKVSGSFMFKNVDVDKTTTDDEAKDLELGTGTEVEGETKVKKGKLAPDNLTKFKKLTIESLGKLKPKLAALIELKGDMTKQAGGSFTHNQSKMKFTGTEKQKVSGAFKFKDVEVEKDTSDDDAKDLELDTGTEVEGETKVMKGKLTPDTLTKFQKLTIEALGKVKPKLAALIELKGDMTKQTGGSFTHNQSKMKFTGTEKQKILGGFKFKDVEVEKTTTDDNVKDLEFDTGTEVEGETKVMKGKLTPDTLTKFQNLTIEALGKLKHKLAAQIELKGHFIKKGGGTYDGNQGLVKFSGTSVEQKADFEGDTTTMKVLLTNLAGLRASHKEQTTGKTTLKICDSSVTLDSIASGDKVLIKCGSITTEVIDGPIEIDLGVEENIKVTVPDDSTATATEVTEGEFEIENSADSSGPLTVAFDGVEVEISPGESAEINAEGALELLRQDVLDLGLPKGIQNSLVKKLDYALTALAGNDVGSALNKVNDFINQVRALSGKKFSKESGDALIASAQEVLTLLNVP